MIIGSFFFALIICNRNINNLVGSVSQIPISDTGNFHNVMHNDTLNSIPFDTIFSGNSDLSFSKSCRSDTPSQLKNNTTNIFYDTVQITDERKTLEETQSEYDRSYNLRKNELALNELKSKQFWDSALQEDARKTSKYLNELEIDQLRQRKLDQLNSSGQTYSNTYGTNPNVIEVNGFNKSNGTRVSPYLRTAPNNTIRDNFSTYPNVNPFTGRTGTRYH